MAAEPRAQPWLGLREEWLPFICLHNFFENFCEKEEGSLRTSKTSILLPLQVSRPVMNTMQVILHRVLIPIATQVSDVHGAAFPRLLLQDFSWKSCFLFS